MAAAHVTIVPNGEVVRGDFHLRDARHPIVEHRRQLGDVLEPFECRLAPQFLDCASARAHRMRQLAPMFPVQWVAGEQHIAPHRIGCVGAQAPHPLVRGGTVGRVVE